MLQIEWRAISPWASRALQSEIAHTLLSDMLLAAGLGSSPISQDQLGRPYLSELPHVDFSLSHTKGLVVVALSWVHKGEIPPRVGVDAELLHSTPDRAKRLAARYFAPCERAFFDRHDDEAVATFVRLFTRKEAFAKCRGDGLAKHLRQTDTMRDGFEADEHVRFLAPDAPDCYHITLCVER